MTESESGVCSSWNVTITEQNCYKYGKVCVIKIRGALNIISKDISLFSLPWEPAQGMNNEFGTLSVWDESSGVIYQAFHYYDPSYRLIVLGDVNGINSSMKLFSFCATYICK